MNELVLFLVLGAVFFLLFLILFLIGQPKTHENDLPLPLGALEQIVSLRGLAFNKSDLLLADGDYRMLLSNPTLRPLARQLLRDRGEIVSLWLKLLRDDIRTLWRFRRLLVRSGASVGLAEEYRIASTAVLALALFFLLEVAVTLAGPFAPALLLRAARRQVEAASRMCAAVLSRIPRSNWAEIGRKWAAEFSAVAEQPSLPL